MRKIVFFLFFVIPAVPAALYLKFAGTGFDTYSVSIALGIIAFGLVGNQFVLASRPRFAVSAFGIKGLLSLHGTMPVVILTLAGIHKALKISNGFSPNTAQARLGSSVWWLFAAVSLFAVLFMANTFWLKIGALQKFRATVYRLTGLSYARSRVVHNISVLAAIAITVHVFLSSSSAFSINPAGITFMIAWMMISLGIYCKYRLRGRKEG